MTGVKYIDLGGYNFNVDRSDNHVIKGIYDAIKSTRKRIVLTNVTFDGIKRNDMNVSVRPSDNTLYLSGMSDTTIRLFKINSNDTVSLTVTTKS